MAGSPDASEPRPDEPDRSLLAGCSDAELIALVRGGRGPGAHDPRESTAAFAELYDRHVGAARTLARQLVRSPADVDDLVAGAFTRLLEALRGGRGPDEAFRAYLLTSLRHLAYDGHRAEKRLDLTDEIGDVVGVDPDRTVVPFVDPAVAGLERSLAARAFATLPERWQAVLWHLEVEGDSPADVAPLFGLTPNAVSALAYRAREGLRQAYLQEHLSAGSGQRDRRHLEASEKLGAYTRGGLAKREASKVEAHLAECEECRALAGELRDVNSGLVRSVIAALVLGSGLAGYLASRGAPGAAAAWEAGRAGVGDGARSALASIGGAEIPTAAGVAASSEGPVASGLVATGAVGLVGTISAAGALGLAALATPGLPVPPPATPARPPAPALVPAFPAPPDALSVRLAASATRSPVAALASIGPDVAATLPPLVEEPRRAGHRDRPASALRDRL